MDVADIIIHGAKLHLGGEKDPVLGWVSLLGGRIAAVGEGAPEAGLRGPLTRVIDAQGASLTAGLNDAHLHLFAGGLGLAELGLHGVWGFDALQAAVNDHRAARPDLPFLAAHGADYHLLGDGQKIDRHVLDLVCPDIPMLVMAVDFHTAWANTPALRLAGLERGRTLSPGNEIVLDATGQATGELREFEAIDTVRALNPAAANHSRAAQDPLRRPDVSDADRARDRQTMWRALTACAAQGLTAVQCMDGSLYQLELLAELEAERGLPVRVRMPFHVLQKHGPADLTHAVRWRKTYQSAMLRCDFIKIFADGVMDSGTAHLVEDYADKPGHRGEPLFTTAAMNALVIEADHLGFQVTAHCVGDGAVRQMLDAYQAAQTANGARDSRHRIEHIELVHPDDIPRFAELGVVASMQPTHVPEAGEDYLDLIGPDRARYAFAINALRATGARYVLATDWPIAPLEPMITLTAAMYRAPWPGVADANRLTLGQALDGITACAAWVAFDEGTRGRIAPGMAADLTLLDCDLTRAAATETGLADVGVWLTICNGQITHNALPNPALRGQPGTPVHAEQN